MSATERTVIVADFVLDDLRVEDLPSGRALVRAAKEADADRVAVDVRSTSEGWAIVHPSPTVRRPDGSDAKIIDLELPEARRARCADGRIATLEETMLAAHRAGLGLVLRIHESMVVTALGAALGIMGGEGPAALRARYLAVVTDGRIGKRLRLDARDLPSARHIRATGGGMRGGLHRRFPNLARAAADADDLMIDAALATPERVREKLVPHLRKRGAFVWVAGVAPERLPGYRDVGAGGLLVRRPWSGPRS